MITKSKKKKKILLTISFLSIFFLSLLLNTKISYAQEIEETINISQNFMLDEFSENKGTLENTTSINIDLGSSRWNVTDLELNFTNIKLERQTKTIEDGFEDQNYIYYKNPSFNRKGLGVEIYLPEDTIIYGVYIFGWIDNGAQQVDIQIRDYVSVGNKPSHPTFHHSQTLNISILPGWYFQNFSTPVPLSAGKYYLVLYNNGYSTDDKVYWGLNDIDPKNSSLHISEYVNTWGNGIQNSPFLYKLFQKTDTAYNPEDIEMAVRINNKNYNVSDGIQSGSGNISASVNFSPSDDILHIPIVNNVSAILNFTLDYNINLNNSFYVNGSVLLNENSIKKYGNQWTLDFFLERTNGSYTVKFSYPNSWTNFSVLKDGNLLTHGADYINNTADKAIYILNNTIPDENVPWKITAESPNIGDFTFNGPNPVITAGTESISSVSDPLNGTYTYVLYAGLNPAYEKHRNITNYNGDGSEVLTFSYIIPSIGPNGDWTAVMYWNNESDAGLSTQDFQVTGGITVISLPTDGDDDTEEAGGIDPLLIFAIFLIGSIISAGSFISYKSVKRLKRTRDERRENLTNKIRDIINLNYIMVIEKKSGLNIYEQYIAGKEIDPTLISGFLEAIRAFGIELTKSFDQSQSISLEYKESKVLMSEFKHFRIILILKERPSEELLRSISDLSYSIEGKFGEEIKRFKGIKSQFTGISELVDEHLHTSFISPLKVVERIDVKLSMGERAMIDKAKQIMKDFNLNYIHSTFLISEQKFKPRDVEIVLDLIKKKIFQPTTTTSF